MFHPALPNVNYPSGVDLGSAIVLPPGGEVRAYVRSTGAADGDSLGLNIPLVSTLNAGLAKCRASRGDVVVVLPGHTENISSADQMSSLVAGTRILGAGYGALRPSFTWTTDTSTFLFDVANTSIENCRLFLAGPHAAGTAVTVAAPITVSAAGCAIRRCQIFFGFDANQIVTVGITTTTAADDFSFEDNRCYGEVAGEVTAGGTFLRLNGADRVSIRRNYIAGALATDTDGLIEFLTTLSGNVEIVDNVLYSNGASSTCCIDAGADLVNTGILQRNLCIVDADGTAGSVVITQHANSNLALLDNFLVNNNGERGLVIGTASV
jgi:hypothetical protein